VNATDRHQAASHQAGSREAAHRRVASRLVAEVHGPAELALQVAVSGLAGAPNAPNAPGATIAEELTVTLDGQPQQPGEIAAPGPSRIHLLHPGPGQLIVEYRATVTGYAATPEVTEADRLSYLRPSRYAESDRLAAVSRAEFGGITAAGDLLAAVSSWVGTRLSYVPGSSGPTDGAVQTLLSRQGVCRDYAHLVIALLRALDVPARLAAVYAPGLDPMDFHAVAEALVDGAWRVVDATLLAPRASLVRIATGRDAADTAFLSSYGGAVELVSTEISAVIDGPLPDDNVTDLVSLS
jgi:transglutaminase-like putative cysteine protease